MSTGHSCSHCVSSDRNRRKEGKIRCTKYSQWVDLNDVGCDSYSDVMTPEKMKKIAALYRDFLRDNNK